MTSSVRPLAFCLLLCAAAPFAAAQSNTRLSTDAPVVNFRLPTFTAEGFREWLVRGSEARYHSAKEFEVRELTLTVFSGDSSDRISSMILAPSARVLPEERTVTGAESIRVLNDDLEASGLDWRVHQPAEKVVEISMRKNVRVTFRAELKNLLQ